MSSGTQNINDRWDDIADLIDRWKRKNPEGFKLNMAYVAEIKEELKDPKFAKMDTDGLRMGLSIHPELLSFIEHFHPEFMKSNTDVKEFGRRFTNFQIPERI